MKHFIYILLTLLPTLLWAQVANDLAKNIHPLEIEVAHGSNTTGCTVEWDCVDESLTGKCIEYHNDQWFTFNSGVYRQLYINIMNQQCRDLRGVQLVVLTGTLCEVSTYQVLKCVSLATQDDIYVQLDSLEIQTEHILIVDGYREDNCNFKIEVSGEPKGLPVGKSRGLHTSHGQDGATIHFEWSLPDSLFYKVREFQVFKRSSRQFKSTLETSIPVASNTFGTIKSRYRFADTLARKDYYYYQLIAIYNDGTSAVVDEFDYRLSEYARDERYKEEVKVMLNSRKRKTTFTILIKDYLTDRILSRRQLQMDKGQTFLTYSTSHWPPEGIYKIVIEVTNDKSTERDKFTFDLRTGQQ